LFVKLISRGESLPNIKETLATARTRQGQDVTFVLAEPFGFTSLFI
jgi:hypothetical protein